MKRSAVEIVERTFDEMRRQGIDPHWAKGFIESVRIVEHKTVSIDSLVEECREIEKNIACGPLCRNTPRGGFIAATMSVEPVPQQR